MRKILLLSDIPPCTQWTAGLFLQPLCRLIPEGSLSCFAVVKPYSQVAPPPELASMPIVYELGPREEAPLSHVRKLGKAVSWAYQSLRTIPRTAALVPKIAAFGKEMGAEALWCILEGPTMIRLALPVARALDVPLLTQILDPPNWWLRQLKMDPISTGKVLGEFGRALRASECCATASWNMADYYRETYDATAIPVVPSLDPELACPPALRPRSPDTLTIGMAGQLYASAEWESLLAALKLARWKILGRKVTLRLLGRASPACYTDAAMHLEFLGWNPQHESIRLLSQADVLYCPYWFDRVFELECRHSFPSKLTSYLAAGRPVFLHGPEYASPARFLKQHQAGWCCHSLEPARVIEALEEVLADDDRYAELACRGRLAFDRNLTSATQRDSFAKFLGVSTETLRAAA